jgi:hypothetical protein
LDYSRFYLLPSLSPDGGVVVFGAAQ